LFDAICEAERHIVDAEADIRKVVDTQFGRLWNMSPIGYAMGDFFDGMAFEVNGSAICSPS
jgi:hypothetical protein